MLAEGTGALKKNGPQAIGKSRGGWNTKIHMVAADARTAVVSPALPMSQTQTVTLCVLHTTVNIWSGGADHSKSRTHISISPRVSSVL
jgi:hypothetical protein